MEYKLFDQPHSHDAAFYKDREVADHINQHEHKGRLFAAVSEVCSITTPQDTIADFGCGNGGLLRELGGKLPNRMWGYDLQPSNVADAHVKGSMNVQLLDFINEPVQMPTIAICTEVIEHLVDPYAWTKRLHDNNVRYLIASSPWYETETFHAPFHLWVWTEDSYKQVFEKSGWKVKKHYEAPGQFQIIVAKR